MTSNEDFVRDNFMSCIEEAVSNIRRSLDAKDEEIARLKIAYESAENNYSNMERRNHDLIIGWNLYKNHVTELETELRITQQALARATAGDVTV